MIIDNSMVSMESRHSLVREYNKTEELTVKVGNSKPRAEEAFPSDRVSISEKAMKHLEKDLAKALKHLEKNMDKAEENPGRGYKKAIKHLVKDLDKAIEHLGKEVNDEVGDVRGRSIESQATDQIGFLKNLLEDITGGKVRLRNMGDSFHKHHRGRGDDHPSIERGRGQGRDRVREQKVEASYNMKETLHESEQMNFNSNGIVRTADGREISFSLDMMMSRQYMEEKEISIEASGTDALNLLVDFAGPASALTETTFGFEIEPEESGESLSYLALGSGILTIDLNNDGKIDSMNEMVGTSTGNGFEELAAHDLDGNGWIDENDPVYKRLHILSEESLANGEVNGLKESNIGAINLGSVDSPYTLKNDQNETTGQIEKSGVYLAEDGTVGQIQQLSVKV